MVETTSFCDKLGADASSVDDRIQRIDSDASLDRVEIQRLKRCNTYLKKYAL